MSSSPPHPRGSSGFFDILKYIYFYGCVRVHVCHIALVEVSGQLAGVVLSVLISRRGVLGTELKWSGVAARAFTG